jgi:hypothetical protein
LEVDQSDIGIFAKTVETDFRAVGRNVGGRMTLSVFLKKDLAKKKPA